MSEAQEPQPAVVLVVANETLAGDEVIAAVRRRAERGPIRAIVAAPVSEPSAGYVVYEDSRRAAAGRRLDRTVKALRDAGVPAHGGVFDHGPLTAVKDIVALEHVDELIVSTHPEAKSGWLQSRQVTRAQDPSLAQLLAQWLYLKRTLKWDEALEQKVAALSPEQIAEAMREHIDLSKLSIVKAGNFAGSTK